MYTGTLLPKWYIGSTSIQNIYNGYNGYNGSITSKQWIDIYIDEQTNNKNLFKSRILSTHNTRKEALIEELRVQKLHNVVKNDLYINKSYATINGCFGMKMDKKTIENMVNKRKNNEYNCYHNNKCSFKDINIIEKIKQKRKNNSMTSTKDNSYYNMYIIQYENKEYSANEFCKYKNISDKNFRTFLQLNSVFYINETIINNFLYLKSLEPVDKKFLYRNIIEKDNIKYKLYYKLDTPDGFNLIYKYIHKNNA